MDHEAFDRWVRLLGRAGSRRAALASLFGTGSLGIVGAALGKKKGKEHRDGKGAKRKGKKATRKKRRDSNQQFASPDQAPAGDAVAAESADCSNPGPSSNMNKCNFNDRDFAGMDLSSSSMRETRFRGANLCEADLSSSQLKDADFRGLSATNRTNLTRVDLHSSGCAGTKFDANTVLCQTKTCTGTVNNRDCPASGPVCCDTDDCPERACQTGVCQSPGCVYTTQPDGQPGTLCEAPLECCNGDCTDTATASNNCGACGEACGPGKACENGECVCTCAQDGCFLFDWGQLGAGDGDLEDPGGVAVAANGDVYVADTGNSRIQRFSATGDFLNTWGRLGGADGEFRSAVDVAVAANGDVYVVDFGNDRIQVFNATGNFLFEWGQEGDGDGDFGAPSGVAVAPMSGDVYVAEFGLGIRNTARVQRFSATGQFLGKWGQQGDGDGDFGFPQGIAVAPNGDVYVADSLNSRIQRFSATGTFLGKWGQIGSGADDFSFSTRVAVAPNGDIYVSDTGAHRIKVFCVNPG